MCKVDDNTLYDISSSQIVVKSKYSHKLLYSFPILNALFIAFTYESVQCILTVSLISLLCLAYFLYSTTVQECLLMIPGVGICVKAVSILGNTSSQFYSADIIKDVIILEAVSLQRIVPYLAIVSMDHKLELHVHPLFMKSKPPLHELKKMYRQIQTTYFNVYEDVYS